MRVNLRSWLTAASVEAYGFRSSGWVTAKPQLMWAKQPSKRRIWFIDNAGGALGYFELSPGDWAKFGRNRLHICPSGYCNASGGETYDGEEHVVLSGDDFVVSKVWKALAEHGMRASVPEDEAERRKAFVSFMSPSGKVHLFLKRRYGGASRSLCGRVGEGWSHRGSDRPTCLACISKMREV